MTDNLAETLRVLVETILAQGEVGARYAVELRVVGPLTVEEAVTHLWSRVRTVQVWVTESKEN